MTQRLNDILHNYENFQQGIVRDAEVSLEEEPALYGIRGETIPTEEEEEAIRSEIMELTRIVSLADAIEENAKGQALLSALVEAFRDEADIMIATEAADEGINLQFCSLVVNYDLPWNPQRIEQRIGRCHRYGQRHDVVAINFLNRANAADKRVFELFSDKFRLFSGIFGASDEILGSIESGVDFERRVAEIYQKCRTPEEIQTSFDALQESLSGQISAGLAAARQKLLEHFDGEVAEKLHV